MKIIKTNWKWNNTPQKRSKTEYIILHHAAAQTASAADIDRWHKNNGWSGIGYHLYIRKDGTVYEGRPIDVVGAQCTGYNSNGVGICFEGNFELEQMGQAQIRAGAEVLGHVKSIYPKAEVKRHKDLYSTSCPGVNFPFEKIVNPAPVEITSVNDIVWELAVRGLITDKALWLDKLENDTNAYWLARKFVNDKGKAGV